MKMMKKLAVVLLAVMLICPCFSNLVYAQDGLAFFTDLETKVGDNFTITGTVVDKSSGVLGATTVELKYDTQYMRFVEGDSGVTAADGVITYQGSGDGSSDRLTFDMTFQALKEGETQLDQITANVSSNNGTALTDFTMGYSAITIAEGDPSKIQESADTTSDTDNVSTASSAVMVGEVSYTISGDFSEGQIPAGFTAAEFTYNGETCKGIKQESSGITAAYLVDSAGSASFFLFNESKNEFYPYEEIMISDAYSILILDGSDEVKMPEKYTVSTVDINGYAFPVWMEPSREGFYIFYAVNNDGEKSLYLYDSVEHTYQRMETPKTAESEGKEVSGMDKMLAGVQEHLIWFVVGMGCALVILIVLSIVLAVKLKHRNLELDDLYDEYGIDLDTKEKPKKNYYEDADALDSFADRGERAYAEDDYLYDEPNDGYDAYDEYDDYESQKEPYVYEEDEYEEDYGYEDSYGEEPYAYEGNEFYENDELASYQTPPETAAEANPYDAYYDEEDYADYGEYYEEGSADPMQKADTFEMDFIDL